jgi:hypothetical protein
MPTPEPLEQRRRRQAIEGSQAMRDYKQAQQAARERLKALREERLAREAQTLPPASRFPT